MLLLTGGPGTGKTTVIKGIVELYSELHGVSLDPGDYKKTRRSRCRLPRRREEPQNG